MSIGVSDDEQVSKQYTHLECGHGHCYHHSPQWERVGEPFFSSRPLLFWGRFFKTFRRHRHCSFNMFRMSKYVTQQCKRCGRCEQKLLEELVAYCACCGYHFRPRTSTAQAIRDRLLKAEKSD